MTATLEQDLDPAQILQELAEESDRSAFLVEYQAARAAAADPGRYRDLREVLNRWRLIAAAKAKPDYGQRVAEVREMIATGQRGVPMEELIRERQAAREHTR